ncbi:MAG: hypothetical protein WCL08_06755, partial [Verrucomicrobiota bacterium]
TAEHLAVLEDYLKQGGRLLVTGDTGTFNGPHGLLLPRTEDLITPLTKRFPGQINVIKAKHGLDYHEDPSRSEQLREVLAQASHHQPALTAANAPDHIGIYANQGKTGLGEYTVDLVNYHHDLAADQLTTVSATDFTITLRMPELKSTDQLSVESIRYDESAPSNTLRQPLDIDSVSVNEGKLTLRIPPFTHYQILRFSTPKR